MTTDADPVAGSAVYPIGSRVDERGRLEVGGCDVVELAREFGTPAYVYAERRHPRPVRARISTPSGRGRDEFEVIYASKAAPITAIYRSPRRRGPFGRRRLGRRASLALGAGFDPARIHVHGNNKSDGRAAPRGRARRRPCDLRLDRRDRAPRRALRRSRAQAGHPDPGDAGGRGRRPIHYVQTGQLDSKFGLGLADGLAARAVEPRSEVGEPAARRAARAHRLADLRARAVRAGDRGARRARRPGLVPAAERRRRARHRLHERRRAALDRGLRRGQGRWRRARSSTRRRGSSSSPGRSLVGNAGITLYEVGTVKEIPGVRTYVAVDGGMSDNLRPMLYGSRYEALIADRAGEPPDTDGDDRRHALRVERRPGPRRDARRAAGRRRPRHPGDRRLRPRDGQQLQRRPAAAGDLLRGRRRARGACARETYDDLTARESS